MTHTMPSPFPDVALPPGADSASTWEDWDMAFRLFYGASRLVPDATGATIAEVRAVGIQLRDGSVAVHGSDAPSIDVYTYTDSGLTAAQARELAVALLQAAAELDGWTR